MEIDHAMRDGCIVVRLAGQINLFTAPQVQRSLLKELAERPYGIVCDLTGVESIDPVCATVFSTVANHPSTDWPATSFQLCAARPAVAEVLERLAVPRFLPLCATVEEALDRVAARPPQLRDELSLAATATAPAVRARCAPVLAAGPARRRGHLRGRAAGRRAGHQRGRARPDVAAATAGAARRPAAPRRA
jgi:anti-anti-sigma factor